eukprot:CAMPEP_0172604408 /NCGR_PEP_ID=MMETSP1068-20121228/24641_1 /TAXON_ID=35684 /ORGANISM="Pseudopedinella elastica, Strain CCMP716" /LENGTH=78 /DNA_ID=CAMNT_0013406461 /DNA_START=57 /DNA_END=290 /DNA_ORIENTATION=+
MARFVFALLALVGSAAAFAPAARVWGAKVVVSADAGLGNNPAPIKAVNTDHVGKGGMVDTRDPEVMTHEDPRKSISAA